MAKSIAIYRESGNTSTRKVRDVTRTFNDIASEKVILEGWHYVPKSVFKRAKKDAVKNNLKAHIAANKVKLAERLKAERAKRK